MRKGVPVYKTTKLKILQFETSFKVSNLCHTAVSVVLYAINKDLWGRNILQTVDIDSAMDLLKINSPGSQTQSSFL